MLPPGSRVSEGTCVDGFANGLCNYGGDTRSRNNASFLREYTRECSVKESTSSNFTGNCDINVNECVSNPCMNGATCYEGLSKWECDCAQVVNNRTGQQQAFEGEFCQHIINVCTAAEDDCDPDERSASLRRACAGNERHAREMSRSSAWAELTHCPQRRRAQRWLF